MFRWRKNDLHTILNNSDKKNMSNIIGCLLKESSVQVRLYHKHALPGVRENPTPTFLINIMNNWPNSKSYQHLSNMSYKQITWWQCRTTENISIRGILNELKPNTYLQRHYIYKCNLLRGHSLSKNAQILRICPSGNYGVLR